LQIRKLITGQLQTNCYLVFTDRSSDVIIIDPGDDADYIMRVIEDIKKTPSKIIATHGHFDHVLAVTELKLAYNIPFLMHKNDEFLLKRLQSTTKHFLGVKTDPAPIVDKYLKKNDEIKIGKNILKIIETPGHTPGGISLYCEKEKVLFVGDTIFEQGGIGRTDFVYANNNQLMESIQKLLILPKDTVVYAGHGNKTTIKETKTYLAQL
jgi:glyoxylase-like metal-dependent hydrolase (beta-lactamase superfamily II)